MIKKKKVVLTFFAVLLLLLGGLYARKSYQKDQVFSNADFLSTSEKIYGLSVIWETAKTYYGMWDLVPDLDWDAEYQDAISRVLETDNLYAYYNELSAFVALLRDGHSQLGCVDEDYLSVLRNGNGFWISPFALQHMEGAFVLRSAARSILDQIPLGSTIIEINGLPTEEYLEQEYGRYVGWHTYGRREEMLAEMMLLSEEAKELTVAGFTPDRTEFRVSLSYSEQYGSERKQLTDGDFSKELKTDETTYDSFSSYTVEDRIYVAKLPDFGNNALQEEFAQWIEDTREYASAYILDARGNAGGSDGNALAVLQHFIAFEDIAEFSVYKQYLDPRQVNMGLSMEYFADSIVSGSELEQYFLDGQAMYEHRYYVPVDSGTPIPYESAHESDGTNVEPPPVALCAQPVVILTDWNCVSAGEDFIAYAKYAKNRDNITIIGTNTAGGTGQILVEELPGKIFFGVSTYNCVLPDGTPICNNGVQPDIWCEQTVADAHARRDTVLLEAIDHLKGKTTEHD